jgi:hypothetical protein
VPPTTIGSRFRTDFPHHLPCLARIFAGRDVSSRIHHIEQMVRNTLALLERGLGRANFKLAIHRDRIAIHDLATKTLGQRQRQSRLPAARWAEHRQQQRLSPRGLGKHAIHRLGHRPLHAQRKLQ